MNTYTILGLSDHEKWLENTQKALNSPACFRKKLEKIKIWANHDIDTILWKESCFDFLHNVFDPRIAVLSDQKRNTYTLKRYWLTEKWVNGFLEGSIAGFNFSHWFTRNNTIQIDQKTINTIWIDFSAINETKRNIWEWSFKEFEQALGGLFLYMNHDYTMHQLWLNTKKNNISNPIDKTLLKYISMERLSLRVKSNTTEICAAIFHKDILEEVQWLGYPIYEKIIQYARIMCNSISNFNDANIRKYWINILRYVLFPSIKPNHPYIVELQEQYPDINLTPSRWWAAIHTPYITTKKDKKIDITELRKTVIYDLNNNININTRELIAQ